MNKLTEESKPSHRCSIVACGGGGCNILEKNLKEFSRFAELYAVDSDPEAIASKFESRTAVRTYHVAKPEITTHADLEKRRVETMARVREELPDLIQTLRETALPVVVYVCLGGATGSFTAYGLTGVCHRDGLPVKVIASTPLQIEVERRHLIARTTLSWLSDYADVIFTVNNSLPDRRLAGVTKVANSVNIMDGLLARSIKTVLELEDWVAAALNRIMRE